MIAVPDIPKEHNHAATRYAAYIALNVRYYRFRNAWSESYLASVADVPVQAVIDLEDGRAFDAGLAAFDTLDAVATALGVPLHLLFETQREAATHRLPAAVRIPPSVRVPPR